MHRGEDPVAGRREVAHDDVAGLFAAQREGTGSHRLEDIAVADGSLHDGDAGLFEGQDETKVAHDGGYDRVVVQAAFVTCGEGENGQYVVAVDDIALSIDRKAAIGIAVEGETGHGAMFDDGLLQVFEMSRTAVLVDVEPVGLGMNGDDVGAKGCEDFGSDPEGSAVGAVENDGQSVKSDGGGADEMLDVTGDTGTAVPDATDAGAGRALPGFFEPIFYRAFDVVVEFESAASEELDAVIRHRVVARRDHDAHIGGEERGEVGGARRGNDTKQVHVDPCGCKTRDHRSFEKFS